MLLLVAPFLPEFPSPSLSISDAAVMIDYVPRYDSTPMPADVISSTGDHHAEEEGDGDKCCDGGETNEISLDATCAIHSSTSVARKSGFIRRRNFASLLVSQTRPDESRGIDTQAIVQLRREYSTVHRSSHRASSAPAAHRSGVT